MDGGIEAGMFGGIAALFALLILPRITMWFLDAFGPVVAAGLEESTWNNLSAFDAAQMGNLHRLKECLAEGIDVDAKDPRKLTMLHHAAMGRQAQTLELLLQKGASVDLIFTGPCGEATALQIAAGSKWRAGVELLLSYGAQLVPEAAMVLGDIAFFSEYLDSGGDPNQIYSNISLLGRASYCGNIEIARLLLVAGADVNTGDREHGFTPLHYAAQGYAELAQLLLEWGADIERPDEYYSRPLHFAARDGAVDVIQLLLDRGADIEADRNGETPLYCAAKKGQAAAIALLIERGADFNRRKFLDGTPLDVAIRWGHNEAADVLRQQRATR